MNGPTLLILIGVAVAAARGAVGDRPREAGWDSDTITDWVRHLFSTSPGGRAIIVLGCLWLALHFLGYA